MWKDSNSWLDVLGLNQINDLGKIGEQNSRIIKNTTRIPSATGKKAYRVPDAMSKNQRHIKEVKNVSCLHFSSQLKDDIAHANRGKGTVTLIVDNRTRLSKQLQEQINLGNIKLVRKGLNKKVGYKQTS